MFDRAVLQLAVSGPIVCDLFETHRMERKVGVVTTRTLTQSTQHRWSHGHAMMLSCCQ